jgi:hypothetical protein
MSGQAESPAKPGARAAGGAALVAAAAALGCAVCCALPFALPAAALAVSGSVLAVFAHAAPGLAVLAAIAVAGAWAWVGVQSLRSRRRPASSTLITLLAATVALGLALAWPAVETLVVRPGGVQASR